MLSSSTSVATYFVSVLRVSTKIAIGWLCWIITTSKCYTLTSVCNSNFVLKVWIHYHKITLDQFFYLFKCIIVLAHPNKTWVSCIYGPLTSLPLCSNQCRVQGFCFNNVIWLIFPWCFCSGDAPDNSTDIL